MAVPEAFAPVAVTERSGYDESVHFGAVVCLDRSGQVAFAVGDPDVAVYPRSACKPIQAVAMVRLGLRLPPPLLAVVCASHDGTATHRDAVRGVLGSAGLSEEALANTPDMPLDPLAAAEITRAGGRPTALTMNCSGKHAGMLATCVCNGWSRDASYLDTGHPLQAAISATVDELAGEPHRHVGVDGCGAPAHVIGLLALARAFRSIATGAAGPAGDEVYAAMTRHPDLVGGERRDVTQFMRHVPGLLAKDGAEGVFAAALPDGRAVALKIADGANRARPPAMVAALGLLGVDTSVVAPKVVERVMGHGRAVGEVRAVFG